MSADRLDEIKARADAATKGPWHWREGEPTSLVHVTSPRMHPWNILKAPDWGPTLADAEFIAAAREDVPWLVDQVESLERWKFEACEVMSGLRELGKALGLGLGVQITGPAALAEVERLTAERDWLAAQVARVEKLAAGHRCEPYYSRSQCGQCGWQEQWCATCSRQMCGCATETTDQEDQS